MVTLSIDPDPACTGLASLGESMTSIQPVVMLPDDNARAYAESTAPAQIEGASPPLHATEEMRRLATPWAVANAKAKLLESCQLPPGVILDPACGSGTQLAALCSTLQLPGLGVELSGAIAPLAAVNLERCGDSGGDDWLEKAEKKVPFKRLTKPIDVAKAAAFFCSEESGLTTGSIIDYDQTVLGWHSYSAYDTKILDDSLLGE